MRIFRGLTIRLALLLWLTVAGLQAQEKTPETGAGSVEQLRAQLDAFVLQPRFAGAIWGMKVFSLDSGRTLYAHHPERRMSPASNSKLYVGALVLARLGGDYRIVTPLLATAPLSATGELTGDLIIAGRGDTGWNPRRDKQDFWVAFAPFVAELRRAGVRRVHGNIVADATYFRMPPYGASWAADDLDGSDGAEISAVTLDDNYVDLRIVPAAAPGQPCSVEFLQPLSGLVLDNRSVTTAAGTPRTIRVRRLPGEQTVQIFGGLPAGDKQEMIEASVPRPALWFATALKAALQRAGIAVDGNTRNMRWPEPSAGGSIVLGEVRSAPMRDLVAGFMKPSNNLATDLLFAHLGEKQRATETPSWRQSDELGVIALEKFLTENQLHAEDTWFNEGSGLSRNNLTSAQATVSLLAFMARHRESAAFVASLPVAGVDGTLRKRLKGTPAEGNLRAKTGTLKWASNLSGYVTSASGERLAFSFLLNRHRPQPPHKAGDELDELALTLARYHGHD